MTTAYVAPTSLEDALAALAAGGRAVAGGTDLVVGARQGKAPLPDSLVAIHRLAGLDTIEDGPDGLRLGALVTHEQIAADERIRDAYTALADASAIVGSHATRANGTIGGNVMNASPAMETGGPLICLGASATLASARGSREVTIEELFTGPGRTVAEADELLVAVTIPAPAPGTGSAYVRLEYRRQMEIAVVGATALVRVADGRVTAARVAITALAPTIHRVPAAEAALTGSDGGRGAADAAAAEAAAAAAPIADVRASVEYRRAMTTVIARRAIEAAVNARQRWRGRDPGERIDEGLAMRISLILNVNGVSYPVDVRAGDSLLQAVRETIGLTGSKEGCDDSECGACMMLLDGKPVNACSYLAAQADGREVTTVEGLAHDGELSPLQAAFLDEGGVQCGFCTPGMLISATALLDANPAPTEDEVRIALSGNLCRCTGYDGIVRAVLGVAQQA